MSKLLFYQRIIYAVTKFKLTSKAAILNVKLLKTATLILLHPRLMGMAEVVTIFFLLQLSIVMVCLPGHFCFFFHRLQNWYKQKRTCFTDMLGFIKSISSSFFHPDMTEKLLTGILIHLSLVSYFRQTI